MMLSLRAADLVLDQLVAGIGVRNAQKCLGEAHQDHTLFAGKLILVEKRVDTAGTDIAVANRDD